jgi:hypothetical protein
VRGRHSEATGACRLRKNPVPTGLVKVVGTPSHNETVLLRNSNGEPIWPSSPGRNPINLRSLL